MVVYLDCNATTPLDPTVRDQMLRYFDEEFGNAGSRTHEYGQRAKHAVERAREQVAAVVAARRDEVIFTSGATESNNIALLGLLRHGEASGRKHIVSTQIEHKAVLEPLEEAVRLGFEVTLLPPNEGGWVEPETVAKALHDDTLLVSVMHANNETGIQQPIEEIADQLESHPAYFHVDAAQGFGKALPPLRHPRIDLISLSGHKIYGPKGVGALIARRRQYGRPPLSPLQFGGGQERGLRPGTLPVPLVVGLGVAAELAGERAAQRQEQCLALRQELLAALAPLAPVQNGDPRRCLPHVLNVTFPGIDSEALILTLKDLASISNGSACTSASYTPSHVLAAMDLPEERIAGSVRLSWYHGTELPDLEAIQCRIRALQ